MAAVQEMAPGSAEGKRLADQQMLYRRRGTLGMLPIPTSITSTDGEILGYAIGQISSLLGHCQETQGLPPLPTILTSTEGGIPGLTFGQISRLLHRLQETQCLLPLRAHSTSTDCGTA